MGEPTVVERMLKRTIVIVDRVCAVCDKHFRGPESRLYCSMPCRRKAAYERRKDQLADKGLPTWEPSRTEHVDWSREAHG